MRSDLYFSISFGVISFICLVPHKVLNRFVAVKVLKEELFEELEAIEEELKGERRVGLHPSQELYTDEEIRTYFRTGEKREDSLILVDKCIKEAVSEGEINNIFTGAFEKYAIDEDTLFRYARRRGSVDKVRSYITSLNIKLRTDKK